MPRTKKDSASVGRTSDETDSLRYIRKTVCALYEQLKDALPKNLQSELWQFNEWKDIDQSARQEAGFLMEVELGRRLGKTGARWR